MKHQPAVDGDGFEIARRYREPSRAFLAPARHRTRANPRALGQNAVWPSTCYVSLSLSVAALPDEAPTTRK